MVWKSQKLFNWHILVLLLLPIFLFIICPEWIFSPSGFVDSYFYLGYFLHPLQLLKTFPDAYYGTRLPWILPGVALYHFLAPAIANFVLHLGVYYTAVLSLYFILRQTVGARPALVTAVSMGGYAFFLRAVGWDYVDGAVIAYFLLTLLMLTYAITSDRASPNGVVRWRFSLFLSGIFYGCAVYTHPACIYIYAPYLLLYYLIANRKYKNHSVVASFVWVLAGLATISILLGAINYTINGIFFFQLVTIKAAQHLTSATMSNKWKAPLLDWLPTASWLLMPALTCGLSGLMLTLQKFGKVKHNNPFYSLFQISFLGCASLFVFLQTRNYNFLQYSYSSSYLIPVMFLALGSQLSGFINLSRFSKRHFGVFVAAFICFFGFTVTTFNTTTENILSYTLRTAGIHFNSSDYVPSSRDTFFAAIKSEKEIYPLLNAESPLYFWYQFESPQGRLYRSVAALYLWSNQLVNENFPLLYERSSRFQNFLPINRQLKLGQMVAIVSPRDVDVIAPAQVSLATQGLSARLLKQTLLRGGKERFMITFLSLVEQKS